MTELTNKKIIVTGRAGFEISIKDLIEKIIDNNL